MVDEGEGDGDVGVRVDKIGSAIYRVDYECRGGCEGGGCGCGFFA